MSNKKHETERETERETDREIEREIERETKCKIKCGTVESQKDDTTIQHHFTHFGGFKSRWTIGVGAKPCKYSMALAHCNAQLITWPMVYSHNFVS